MEDHLEDSSVMALDPMARMVDLVALEALGQAITVTDRFIQVVVWEAIQDSIKVVVIKEELAAAIRELEAFQAMEAIQEVEVFQEVEVIREVVVDSIPVDVIFFSIIICWYYFAISDTMN